MICQDDDTIVYKSSSQGRYSEEVAMRLVEKYTSVPVPGIILSSYEPGKGTIEMTCIPGCTLASIWDELDELNKERICREIWAMIASGKRYHARLI